MPSNKRQRQKEGRDLRRQAMADRRRKDQRKRQILTFLVIAAVLFLIVSLVTRNSGDDNAAESTTTSAATGCPPADGVDKPVTTFSSQPPQCTAPDKTYVATFDTTEGKFEVNLDIAGRPNTVNNFVFLARNKYYDNNKVFRLAEGIDIWQSGSPHTQTNADQGPGYTINDEGPGGETYKVGDLMMANTGQPNSSGAQYFFGAGPDVSNLNGDPKNPTDRSGGTYIKFGRVTSGLDVVEKILTYHAKDANYDGAPNKDIVVRSVTIRES